MPVPSAPNELSHPRRLFNYGDRAVLVECADLDETVGLMLALQQRRLEVVEEIVPGARTLLLPPSSPAQPSRGTRPADPGGRGFG